MAAAASSTMAKGIYPVGRHRLRLPESAAPGIIRGQPGVELGVQPPIGPLHEPPQSGRFG